MKTIKVIDIFNKLANGEEIPTFRISDDRYKYFEKDGFLYEQKRDEEPEAVSWEIYTDWLNNEVEIIEDKPTKIEEISYKYTNTYGNISQHRKSEEPIIDKINELVRTVNDLVERGDSNE